MPSDSSVRGDWVGRYSLWTARREQSEINASWQHGSCFPLDGFVVYNSQLPRIEVKYSISALGKE